MSGFTPSLPVSTSPRGNWVGAYGSAGYDLAAWEGSGDLVSMAGVNVELLRGSRYVWASSSAEERALESPDASTRKAATLYDSNEVKLRLSFTSAYKGELHLYALDWDSGARRETINVAGHRADELHRHPARTGERAGPAARRPVITRVLISWYKSIDHGPDRQPLYTERRVAAC